MQPRPVDMLARSVVLALVLVAPALAEPERPLASSEQPRPRSPNEPAPTPPVAPDHTAPDVDGAALGTTDFEFQLRSERSGTGNGRTYRVCNDQGIYPKLSHGLSKL